MIGKYEPACAEDERYLISLFDTRHPFVEDRLAREQRAWHGRACVEWLDQHHAALVLRPGGLLEAQR